MLNVDRCRTLVVALSTACVAVCAPSAAFAQSTEDVAQAIGRAEAAVALVGQSPALAGPQPAPAAVQIATERLNDARSARDSGNRDVALWRAGEAELEARVAIAELRRAALERRAQELNDAVSALEREASL
jgi:hypothetical protein